MTEAWISAEGGQVAVKLRGGEAPEDRATDTLDVFTMPDGSLRLFGDTWYAEDVTGPLYTGPYLRRERIREDGVSIARYTVQKEALRWAP